MKNFNFWLKSWVNPFRKYAKIRLSEVHIFYSFLSKRSPNIFSRSFLPKNRKRKKFNFLTKINDNRLVSLLDWSFQSFLWTLSLEFNIVLTRQLVQASSIDPSLEYDQFRRSRSIISMLFHGSSSVSFRLLGQTSREESFLVS